MHIKFDKVDGVIKIYDGTTYLELLGSRIYKAIYDMLNYLISKKSDAKYIINHILQESELIHIILYP